MTRLTLVVRRMAKKSKDWLIFPEVHSELHSEAVESALIKKAQEIFGKGDGDDTFKFFLLTGNFLGTHGFTYSAVRYWPGAVKPESKKSGRRPVLDATFSCIAIYLSGLVNYQADYDAAYEEIKNLLENNGRPDLAEIISEKLPFVSLPPKEMLKEGQTPVTPYYLIKHDEQMLLAELYSSVQLTEIAESIRSRYFVFFSHEGYSAFGFFDNLPEHASFGFDTPPREFEGEPDEQAIIDFINNDCSSLKDLFSAFISVYNNGFLIQYKIDDYESLLTKILEYNMEELN